jgi:hypothetical protein
MAGVHVDEAVGRYSFDASAAYVQSFESAGKRGSKQATIMDKNCSIRFCMVSLGTYCSLLFLEQAHDAIVWQGSV